MSGSYHRSNKEWIISRLGDENLQPSAVGVTGLYSDRKSHIIGLGGSFFPNRDFRYKAGIGNGNIKSELDIDFTYKLLAFHTYDSRCLRRFCRIGIADKGFKKSALNANLKCISEQTWEAIFRDLLGHAKDEKIEKGRKVRITQ